MIIHDQIRRQLKQRQRQRQLSNTSHKTMLLLPICILSSLTGSITSAFHSTMHLPRLARIVIQKQQKQCQQGGIERSSPLFMVYAPPGSGYARPEDEEDSLPSTYEPMMEYPGTMRPGKTPENMPYHDLPIADSDPDPVPWPHFQQIEWHHKWEPPHAHPIPMENFIEMHGRWATPEMEAAMRAGVRKDLRKRQQEEETSRADGAAVIVDDDDDDDAGADATIPVSLGDGMFGQLGSAADQAVTAAAVAPPEPGTETEADSSEKLQEPTTDEDDLDDFLLDLGLDAELGDDDVGDDDSSSAMAKKANDDDSSERTININVDDLDDEEDASSLVGVDDDDDEEIMDSDDAVSTVPLEAFDDEENPNSLTSNEDVFDDGGYDFGDMDGGDFDDNW